jgi:hypothetical protein
MRNLKVLSIICLCLSLPFLLGGSFVNTAVPPITASSSSPVVQIGSYAQIGHTGIICLSARVAGATKWSTLRQCGAAAGYAVTAGKTLVITQINYKCNSANGGLIVGYGNTDVGLSGAAAPTTPVYFTGGGVLSGSPFGAPTAYTGYIYSTYFAVPAGKYPVIYDDAGAVNSDVVAWGVEF